MAKRIEYGENFWSVLYSMSITPVTLALRSDNYTHDTGWIDYIGISIEDPNMISYLTEEKHKRTVDANLDVWAAKFRVRTKPAAFLEKMYPGKFNDKQKEEFTGEYRARVAIMFPKIVNNSIDLQFVEGEDIRKYYHEENYAGQSGSLGNSCMKHANCQSFLDIYVENPEVIGMAVVLDKHELVTLRGICWYPEGKAEGKPKYYDRLYYLSETTARKAEVILEEMGYVNMAPHNPSYTVLSSVPNLVVTLKKVCFDHYPYFDNMIWLDMKKKTLHQDGSGRRGLIALQSTGGGPDIKECACCGHVDIIDRFTFINIGRFTGNYLCNNCTTYSSIYSQRIPNEDSVLTTYAERVLETDVVTLHDGHTCWRLSAIQLYDGTYCHNSEEHLTSKEGLIFLRGDINFERLGRFWYSINSTEYIEKTKEKENITNESL